MLAAAGLLDRSARALLRRRLGERGAARARCATARGSCSRLGAPARVRVARRTRANRGPTLGPADPIPPDYARFEAFPEGGTAASTVALYSGA